MSGPKRSHYQIQQNHRYLQLAARRAARIRELKELAEEVEHLRAWATQFGGRVESRVHEWLAESDDQQMSLRSVKASVKGARQFLERKREEYRAREIERLHQERCQQEEAFQQRALAQEWFDVLDSLEHRFPELAITAGVAQRLTLFREALETNPTNTQTQDQILALEEQLKQMDHKAALATMDHEIVVHAVTDILGGKGSGSVQVEELADGRTRVVGTVGGMPMSVHLKPGESDFSMQTPEDGSCRKGLDALMTALGQHGVALGPIHIVRTGQTLQQKEEGRSQESKLDA